MNWIAKVSFSFLFNSYFNTLFWAHIILGFCCASKFWLNVPISKKIQFNKTESWRQKTWIVLLSSLPQRNSKSRWLHKQVLVDFLKRMPVFHKLFWKLGKEETLPCYMKLPNFHSKTNKDKVLKRRAKSQSQWM